MAFAVRVEIPNPVDRVRFIVPLGGSGFDEEPGTLALASYDVGSAEAEAGSSVFSLVGLADRVLDPDTLALLAFFRFAAAAALAAAALTSLAFARSFSACSALATSRGDGTSERSFLVSVARE
jgi:hypothetical protein